MRRVLIQLACQPIPEEAVYLRPLAVECRLQIGRYDYVGRLELPDSHELCIYPANLSVSPEVHLVGRINRQSIQSAADAARKASPEREDRGLAALQKSKVGPPVMVYTPAGGPSYWLVPYNRGSGMRLRQCGPEQPGDTN